MILNISSDPQERMNIWLLTGACFYCTGNIFGCLDQIQDEDESVQKCPARKSHSMENELYYYVRKSKGIWK